MNTVLWIVQIILGIKLLTVTYTHGLRQSKSEMHASINKMGSLARPLHYLIAAFTFIGMLGIILPGFLQTPALMTPFSALGSAFLLLVSIYFHAQSREKPKVFVSLVLLVFSLFVAYGRWALAPYGS